VTPFSSKETVLSGDVLPLKMATSFVWLKLRGPTGSGGVSGYGDTTGPPTTDADTEISTVRGFVVTCAKPLKHERKNKRKSTEKVLFLLFILNLTYSKKNYVLFL
jgi:hypothetical protein